MDREEQDASAAPEVPATQRRWPWPVEGRARVIGAAAAGVALAAVLAGGAWLALGHSDAVLSGNSEPRPPVLSGGDPGRGREAYRAGGCPVCHGAQGEGGRFPGAPPLAGSALSCEQMWLLVRRPRDPAKGMPPYPAEQVSDANLRDICAWAHSLP